MPHNLDVAPTEVVRSSRYSRLTSLSSMMSSQHDDLTPHKEMLGLRRLARYLWLDVSGKSAKKAGTQDTACYSSSNSALITPNNTFGYVTLEDLKIDQAISGVNYTSPRDQNISRSHFDLKSKPVSYFKDVKHAHTALDYKSKPLTETRMQNVQANVSLKYIDAFQNQNSVTTFAPSKRALQFRSLPSLIGLRAVLSQVVGGPLQKILILDADKSFQRIDHSREYGKFLLRNRVVEMWFLRPEQALEFFQYCQSGSYVVNGFHFTPEWAPQHDNYSADHSFFHERLEGDIAYLVDRDKATRCLSMKCTLEHRVSKTSYAVYKPSRSRDGNEKRIIYSLIDMEGIKMDFSQFGDIVEVAPLLSRRIAISIHYFDISSAITAMALFRDSTSELKKKYTEWSLAYERDITDKPCINV